MMMLERMMNLYELSVIYIFPADIAEVVNKRKLRYED